MKDLGGMMKQVQAMQERMAEMQAKLEAMAVEGRAGGGLVLVKMTGKGAVTSVEIDASLMKPDEKEILEDLLVTALGDAKKKSEQLVADNMEQVTGGMRLPPGFKLPFG
jgi:nucleoid-associated protein EbfC